MELFVRPLESCFWEVGGGDFVGGLVAESCSTFSQGTVFILICRDASPWLKQV